MVVRGFRFIGLNGLLIVLYVVLGRLTLTASVEHGSMISVMFAPEGVALAFSILFGTRVVPGVLLGQALLSYGSDLPFLAGLGIGAFNSCEIWLGGYLFRRWGLSRGFDRPRDVIRFALMIFAILQPISATGGVIVLHVIGVIPLELAAWFDSTWLSHGALSLPPALELLYSTWVHWWLGNSLGQLLVAPLLVAWLTPRKNQNNPPHPFELPVMLVGTASVLLLVYYNLALRPVLLTLEYALMIWIGLRHSIRVVSVFNMLVMVIIVWEAAQPDSFLSNLATPDRLFYVSFFVATGVFASLMLFSMFEERRDLIQQLTELACKDALTQVSNRRHFMESAERELTLAQRYGYPVSLVLIDLDHFKTVNDQYGHETGDQALSMFAECCRQVVRSSDMVGRLGGEEFALLLPHTNVRDAVHTTERLRQMVRSASLRSPDSDVVPLTFSAGVVQSCPQISLADMYRAADTALYGAKYTGRNQVKIAGITRSPSTGPRAS